MDLDHEGKPHPTGKLETLAADTLIMAVGQDADTAFLRQVPDIEFKQDGTVMVSSSMMTGCPGVFAGGDMVPAGRIADFTEVVGGLGQDQAVYEAARCLSCGKLLRVRRLLRLVPGGRDHQDPPQPSAWTGQAQTVWSCSTASCRPTSTPRRSPSAPDSSCPVGRSHARPVLDRAAARPAARLPGGQHRRENR